MTETELRVAIERGFPTIVRTNPPSASAPVAYDLPQWAVYVMLYHVVPRVRAMR